MNNAQLKKTILDRFPRFKIKRQSIKPRLVEGREIKQTHVALVTDLGNVWAHTTATSFEEGLKRIEFRTRGNHSVMLGNLDA